jgi:GNAT superfamily N-acetyltransferase
MVVFQTLTRVPQEWFPRLVQIYRLAFIPPPYCKGEEEVIYFRRTLPEHVRRPGFRLVAALKDESLIGYGYGYTCSPEYYWAVLVSEHLTDDMIIEWLSDAFYLAEMALLPSFQGLGIGGEMHDRILTDLPNRTAVLSTMYGESNAFHLYAQRGWQILVPKFTPPGMSRPYRVMGRMLTC